MYLRIIFFIYHLILLFVYTPLTLSFSSPYPHGFVVELRLNFKPDFYRVSTKQTIYWISINNTNKNTNWFQFLFFFISLSRQVQLTLRIIFHLRVPANEYHYYDLHCEHKKKVCFNTFEYDMSNLFPSAFQLDLQLM